MNNSNMQEKSLAICSSLRPTLWKCPKILILSFVVLTVAAVAKVIVAVRKLGHEAAAEIGDIGYQACHLG